MVFATKRGRELCKGTPSGVVEDNGAFSEILAVGGVPGALGTENFAKETGLNDVGLLVELARELSLLSVRLASDSEPP